MALGSGFSEWKAKRVRIDVVNQQGDDASNGLQLGRMHSIRAGPRCSANTLVKNAIAQMLDLEVGDESN